MKKKLFFVVWTLFWVVLLSFGILELGVRTGLIRHSFQMWEIVYQLDPRTLFRIKPYSHPSIGPYGNRLHGPDHPGAKDRIAVMGDSFVYATNVGPTNSFPAALNRLAGPDTAVFNFGVAGYGPDQALRFLQTYVIPQKPTYVVFMIFPANDYNDLIKNQLYSVDESGHLLPRTDNSLQQHLPRFQSDLIWDLAVRTRAGRSKYVDLYKSFFYDKFDWDFVQDPTSPTSLKKQALMKGVLIELKSTLEKENIPVLVITIPAFESLVEPQQYAAHGVPEKRTRLFTESVITMCNDLGLPCLNLADDFESSGEPARWYDSKDHHLSPEGYARAAQLALPMIEATR